MRVQLVFAFVALLAVSTVSARHVAKHKVHKQHAIHNLEKSHTSHQGRHLSKHEMREFVSQKTFGKSFEELKKFLLAYDFGSSGPKVGVYAQRQEDCPTVASGCDMVKMEKVGWPALVSSSNVARLFDAPWSAIKTKFDEGDFEGFIAKATAGNRIIEETHNQTAWRVTTSHINTLTGLSPAGTAVIGDPSTMPGTMEAWVEFKKASSMTTPHNNLLSMGGASGQLTFDLTTNELLDAFEETFTPPSMMTNLPCDNQKVLPDFVCLIEKSSPSYECVPWNEKGKCRGGKCIGAISFLSGGVCPFTVASGGHHRAGGLDGMVAQFVQWRALQSDKDSCKVGKESSDCLAAMQAYLNSDVLLSATSSFASTYKSAISDAKWVASGSMFPALFGASTPCSGTITSERTTFFQCFARALANEAGVGPKMVKPNPEVKIDWLESAAALVNYNFPCDIPQVSGSCKVAVTL